MPPIHPVLRFALVTLTFAVPSHAAETSPARPNILWIVSEDNAFNYVGAYGDPLARTPNLDRLAATGIVYERAYAPAPVCAPTRSSIITGVYASSIGTQPMRSQRPLPTHIKFFPEYLRAAGYFTSNNAKTDYNTSTPWAAPWSENNKTAHYRHRAPGQPFFAIFNTEESHESRLHTRQPLITDPAKVRVPAYLPDTPETRADLAQYYDCVSRADAFLGKILANLAADGLAEDTIVFYYSDHGGAVSRSKRFLYENGTHPALLVHFPKKFAHLAPAPAGSRVTDLVNFVDLAPTVLSLARVPAPDHFQGRAFAGPARAPAPAFTYSFRDRMDERPDLSRAVTDGRFRYIRNYLPHLPAGQHLAYLWKQASMKKWHELYLAGQLAAVQRAFFEPRAPEELFDCAADPDNVRNLAADPAHGATLERLRAANRAHLLRIRDTGFFPEPMMSDLVGDASPVTITASATTYPLASLLDFIDACHLGTATPAEIATAARDPLAVVRFWAVTASLSRSPALAPAALLTDPDASVRLAAAGAALRSGPDAAAFRVIAESLSPQASRELRLSALNTLTPGKFPAEEFALLLTTAAKSNAEYLMRGAEFLLAPSQ
jgi:N-sulfoglucosamine sulfohydrolase